MSGFELPSDLLKNDSQLSELDTKNYHHRARSSRVDTAKTSLEKLGFKVDVVDSKDDALNLLKKVAPKGSSIYNGGSTTLWEIGFTDYLQKGEHGWINLHAKHSAESDQDKKQQAFREALTADYFFTSANALGEDGSLVLADATGNRIGGAAAASNVVFVIGSHKIVPTYMDGIKRLEEWALPLESARARIAYKAYGVKGSAINNMLVIRGGNPFSPKQRIQVIIVKDKVGF